MSAKAIVKKEDQADLDRLETLEEIVETVMVPFGKGLAALIEILRDELYKLAGYKTEDEYLDKRWQHFHISKKYLKKSVLGVAKNIGQAALPDGIRQAHLAVLTHFEPSIQKKAVELAWQQTPEGKEPTAAMIERIARQLNDERLADAREEAAQESFRKAQAAAAAAAEEDEEEEIEEEAEEEQEDEDEGEEEETPLPPPAPKGKGGRPSVTERMLRNPIVNAEAIRKWYAQAWRWQNKGKRMAAKGIELDVLGEGSDAHDLLDLKTDDR